MRKIIFLALLALSIVSESKAVEKKGKKIALSEQALQDKVKGAWAGQTLGCSYGGPTEFKFLGTIIQDFVPIPWNKNTVKKWYNEFPGLYDDVYVDLTFVEVFERCGLDAPVDSFAVAFAKKEYPLWHANQVARYNLSQGMKAPQSGHWKNNPHAHCIDFQIEADFAGIMSPGMPNEAAAICDKVRHIMSYGEGWYGGVYVAAMYSLAYVSDDIEYIVSEALKVIPAESDFHKCMSDVIRWHKKYPKDWKRTWFELQNKWSEEISCPEGIHNSFNIGTKINGAYVILGLLYGQGDFEKTIDISTRTGQDSDCNPATAAGILGTMIGYNKIPEKWKEALYEVENVPFSHTALSLSKAYEMTYRHACAMLEKHGHTKEGNHYLISKQKIAPVALEVAFENLTVSEKLTVEKNIDDVNPFSFNGKGVVVKGYVAGKLPASYTAEMDVYVDGKFYQTTALPLELNYRKPELFYCYDLPLGKHDITFKYKNPILNGKIWITEVIVYTEK